MSEDDTAEIGEGFTEFSEGVFDAGDPSDEAAIDEVNFIFVDDEMMLDEESAKLDDFSHK